MKPSVTEHANKSIMVMGNFQKGGNCGRKEMIEDEDFDRDNFITF